MWTEFWQGLPPELQSGMLVLSGTLIAAVLTGASALAVEHVRQRSVRTEHIRRLVHEVALSLAAYQEAATHLALEKVYGESPEMKESVVEPGITLRRQFWLQHASARASCLNLMAVGERKLADAGQRAEKHLARFHRQWARELLTEEGQLNQRSLADLANQAEGLQLTSNVLLNMVEPRIWNRMLVFRRWNTAEKTARALTDGGAGK